MTLLKSLLFAVITAATLSGSCFARDVTRQPLPFKAHGVLHGWETREWIFKGESTQTIRITAKSSRPTWMVVLLLPTDGNGEAIFNSDNNSEDLGGDVTLPAAGDYTLRIGIRRPEARRGGRLTFSVGVSE